ncbi:unnamed protein product [Protopolystoma xenopodis]|uniref:Uncharacterized protein n=1 Tax=Protopolystoma xenopodis TaxID=117903 RepID=A0A3S5BN44_9PLAT|nr:unnamed protein product [Protopolystoma xenopodis]
MAKLTDVADYDADETSGNVPRPWSGFGKDYTYNGLRTRCVSLSFPTNMTNLRKQGQTTFIPILFNFGMTLVILWYLDAF